MSAPSTEVPTKIESTDALTPLESARTDIILSISHTATEDYMAMIVQRQKTHEFRTRRYPPTVERVWFYETAPTSAITYICHVGPVVVRPPRASAGESRVADLLKEDGYGNADYNAHHPDFERYDYAYPVLSCYRLRRPIGLVEMKDRYGTRGAPRGMVYVPQRMKDDVKWQEQEEVWSTL